MVDLRTSTPWTRAGGVTFIASGIVLALAWLILPELQTAPDKSFEFASGADNTRFRVGASLIVVSIALEMIASVALFAWLSARGQTGLAFAGLLLTIVAGALFLPAIGFFMVVLPVVGGLIADGQADALNVVDAYYNEPTAMMPFLAGALFQLRSIVFGIAIWQARTEWRWTGIWLAVGGVVLVPAFFDVYLMQLIGPFVLAGAMGAVGVVMWRSASESTSE